MLFNVSADPHDRLAIYLDDHLAVIAGERELALRSRKANASTSFAPMLTLLVDDLAIHEETVRGALGSIGETANPLKPLAARIGERLGRLKLNGSLFGYSSLSRIVEFEALLAAATVRAQLWQSLTVSTEVVDDTITGQIDLARDATGIHIEMIEAALEDARHEAFTISSDE